MGLLLISPLLVRWFPGSHNQPLILSLDVIFKRLKHGLIRFAAGNRFQVICWATLFDKSNSLTLRHWYTSALWLDGWGSGRGRPHPASQAGPPR